MWLGQKTRKKIFIAAGFMLFTWVIGSFFGSLINAAEREPVFMSKVLDAPNTTEVYNQLSIKIKASKPFKISLQVITTTDECYWIIYSATNDAPIYDPMEGLIEKGIGSDLVNGEWQTIIRDVQLDLEEYVGIDLKYIKKIEILGINFGIRYVTVYYEKEVNGWLTPDYHINTNFGDSVEDPLDEMGWKASDHYCFSLEYDNLYKYLQALGPLPKSEDKKSSSYNYAPDSIRYSATDYGGYYSPYSPMGGYYDNYYGSWGLGGYGLGLGGYGLGLGGYGLGLGGYGLGLGGYGLGLGGIGLGGFGLPYSGYGLPSPLGGITGNPLGVGFSPYTGLGLGSSSLFSGFASSPLDFSATSNSFEAFIPRIFDVDYSTSLALSGFPTTELSGITVQHTSYVPATITYY